MNGIKVGSQGVGNVYLGTNQLSKSGMSLDLDIGVFLDKVSSFAFINETSQSKSITIHDGVYTHLVDIPGNAVEVVSFDGQSDTVILTSNSSMTISYTITHYNVGSAVPNITRDFQKQISANYDIYTDQYSCGIFYITA